MKKLSDEFQELENHVADAKKRAAAAEQASKEKVEALIQKSKTDAEARKESFKDDVKKRHEAAFMHWQELQKDYHQKVQHIKNKIKTEKEAKEVKHATQRADDAEAYAEYAIDFAMMAIDDAELAVLEAIDARVYAERYLKSEGGV